MRLELRMDEKLDSRLFHILKLVLLLALLISHDVEAQRLVLILLLVKCSEQIQMVHWLVVFDGLLRAKVH